MNSSIDVLIACFNEEETIENQENENSWVGGAATQEAAKNKKIKPPTYVTKALRKK